MAAAFVLPPLLVRFLHDRRRYAFAVMLVSTSVLLLVIALVFVPEPLRFHYYSGVYVLFAAAAGLALGGLVQLVRERWTWLAAFPLRAVFVLSVSAFVISGVLQRVHAAEERELHAPLAEMQALVAAMDADCPGCKISVHTVGENAPETTPGFLYLLERSNMMLVLPGTEEARYIIEAPRAESPGDGRVVFDSKRFRVLRVPVPARTLAVHRVSGRTFANYYIGVAEM